MPGTTLGYVLPKLERLSGLKVGRDFYLAYCPERTIEGMALYELHNLPKIIGGVDPTSGELAACLLEKLGGKVIKVSSPTVAEMCKLADNVYRTVNIVLANELASLCEALGVDSYEVVSAVNSAYARTHIYTPGLGAHGPCLPKDTKMARYLAFKSNVTMDVLNACIKGNKRPISKVKAIITQFIKEKKLINPKIALLGLAFKGWPETVDVRSSPAIETLSYLRKTGISRVSLYDPLVREIEGMKVCKSVGECVKGANVILQLTNHPALMNLNVQTLLEFASRPLLIVDCWHSLKNIEDIDDEVSIYVMGKGWYPSRSS
jgi:UDP-N-acetyl-D-mannosaminuronic acid dehydrogenase